MANKLYEESSISDIAVAIRETVTGTSDTYTVAQMDEALRSANRRVYKGTVTSTIVGSNAYLVIAKEDILAEHRNDENLFVRVEFDIEPTAYTVVKTWGSVAVGKMPLETYYQLCRRYDGSGNESFAFPSAPVNSTAPLGVGSLQITADGELRIYSKSSSNYAIRPSNYVAIVEW